MSSQEKIQIQMTLLKELAARDKPFVHQNDKTFFLRDFYQRCGVSKLFHQLVADFFHNNIQRGSCPKWARSDPNIRDTFARVREVYGACMQPSRQRKTKSDTSDIEEFAKQLELMRAQGIELGSVLPSSSSVEENPAQESDSIYPDEGDDDSNKGLSHLDILEKMCFNLKTENASEPAIPEEISQDQSSLQLEDVVLNPQNSQVSKSDFDRLNKKVTEVLRNQKKLASEITNQNKMLQELREIFFSLMANSLSPMKTTVDSPSLAEAVCRSLAGQLNNASTSQMYGSPDSLSYEGSADSPKEDVVTMAMVNQLLNSAQNS